MQSVLLCLKKMYKPGLWNRTVSYSIFCVFVYYYLCFVMPDNNKCIWTRSALSILCIYWKTGKPKQTEIYGYDVVGFLIYEQIKGQCVRYNNIVNVLSVLFDNHQFSFKYSKEELNLNWTKRRDFGNNGIRLSIIYASCFILN